MVDKGLIDRSYKIVNEINLTWSNIETTSSEDDIFALKMNKFSLSKAKYPYVIK